MKTLKLILLISVGIIFTVTLTAYAQDYTIIQLTDDDKSDYSPQINDNNQVAWSGGAQYGGPTDAELFFYDGFTTYQITDNSIQDVIIEINNNGHILFRRHELDGANHEAFLFDGMNIIQLTNVNDDENLGNVDFNDNDLAVWEKSRVTYLGWVYDERSFIFDGTTTTKLEAYLEEYPNATINLTNPKLNNEGQVALLGRIRYGSSLVAYALFLYDGATLNKVIDLKPWPFVIWAPQINDNGYVVWHGSDGSDNEIFLYDGSTITQLTDNDYDDSSPQINNNGHVVWGGTEGIFLYDGFTIIKISEYSGTYQINDNNYVVWWSREPSQDAEIFVYDGSETIQITNNDYDDISPQINNNNYIVWWAQIPGGQAFSEIFLAVPGSPPVAEAGENIAISSEAVESTIIQGTASDPDSSDVLEYRWCEGENILKDWNSLNEDGLCPLELASIFLDIGTHTLTLEVTDGQVTSTDQMILIIENSAPQAAAYGGGVYEYGAEITLCGEVSDFDGDMLDYQWMEDTDVLCTGTIQALDKGFPVELPSCIISGLSLGQHTIALYVDDNINTNVMSDINLEIIDASVPTLAPVPSRSILWPPNHNMIDILIEANATDNSGLPVTLSAIVASNEPEEDLGDGDMAPDWTIPVIDQETGLIQLSLRAERSGSGNGRVYSVVITATDDSNNSSSATVEIVVPHDKNMR